MQNLKQKAILSVCVSHESCAIALIDAQANVQTWERELEVEEFLGLRAIDPTKLFDVLDSMLRTIPAPAEVAGIAITSPQRSTALVRDARGQNLSPVIVSQPLDLALRDVPVFYANNGLASVFRGALVRQLRMIDPGFALGSAVGLCSMGGVLAQYLTGVCADFCRPMGLAYGNAPEHGELINEALGISADLGQQFLPQGALIGSLREEHCKAWGMSSVPVFSLGDARCSQLYSQVSNPLAWGLCLGWEPYFGWLSSREALAHYSMRIVDEEEGAHAGDVASWMEGSTEHSRDEWAGFVSANFPEDYAIIDGPGQNLASFIYQWPNLSQNIMGFNAVPKGVLIEDFDAPVGSSGLHMVARDGAYHVFGLKSGHSSQSILRAGFESCLYDTRRLREQLMIRGAAVPRLSFSAPWSPGLASLACDILGEEIIALAHSPTTLSAVGSALVLARGQGVLPTDQGPKIETLQFEPSPRAQAYLAHYEVHCRLHEILASL